jgi:hypothetical protein
MFTRINYLPLSPDTWIHSSMYLADVGLRSNETLVPVYKFTRHHNPKYHNANCHHRENLKPDPIICVLPLNWKTKFHIHTKQQVRLKFRMRLHGLLHFIDHPNGIPFWPRQSYFASSSLTNQW